MPWKHGNDLPIRVLVEALFTNCPGDASFLAIPRSIETYTMLKFVDSTETLLSADELALFEDIANQVQ